MKYKLISKNSTSDRFSDRRIYTMLVEDIFGRTHTIVIPQGGKPVMPEKESNTVSEISDFLKGQAMLLVHQLSKGRDESVQRIVENMDRIVNNYQSREYKTIEELAA